MPNLTPIQVIGILLVINGALIGSTAQLTDLFGPSVVKYIVAAASLANSILGGIITFISGQGAQIKNVIANPQAQGALVKAVLAMPGVENVGVNSKASPDLATIAVDPSQSKIGPIQGAEHEVERTATIATAGAV